MPGLNPLWVSVTDPYRYSVCQIQYLTFTSAKHQSVFRNQWSQAFPCISTGIYGYPNDAACNVALRAVREFLENNHEVRCDVMSDWINFHIHWSNLGSWKSHLLFVSSCGCEALQGANAFDVSFENWINYMWWQWNGFHKIKKLMNIILSPDPSLYSRSIYHKSLLNLNIVKP